MSDEHDKIQFENFVICYITQNDWWSQIYQYIYKTTIFNRAGYALECQKKATHDEIFLQQEVKLKRKD